MAPNIGNNTDHVEEIEARDRKASNPNVVDDLLTQEMMQLSVKDRNDIQEEIHGVKSLAVEETPELIRESLKELSIEIDQRIPDSDKRAYLQSLEPPCTVLTPMPLLRKVSEPEEYRPESQCVMSSDNHRSASNSHSHGQSDRQLSCSHSHQPLSYIHGDDFRLRFLRCDLFDVKKAAQRLLTYLDLLVEIFGDDALRRPICLSDFTKEELRHMRKGMIQILPYRDRSGRRIFVVFPEEEQSQIPAFVKAKIAMYMLWAAGDNDIVTQQKGVVVLCWFDASFATMNRSWKIKYKFYTLTCDRITAIHCCSPDTPHYRLRRAVMVLRCGKENISKLIFHLGESMEIHYRLQGYGIPFEYVPISWTGKIKVQYLKQWMRIRHAIEHHIIAKHNNTNYCSSNSDGSSDETTTVSYSNSVGGDIIECPQLQDVIFRQGTSGVSHPGNVTFRSLIESIVLREQFERQQQLLLQQLQQQQQQRDGASATKPKSSSQKKPKTKRPKQLALDIFEERQRIISTSGRFLIWNNEKGWWNELTDREQICMKIEYMVREFQKLSAKSNKIPKGSLSSTGGKKKYHNTRKNNAPCGGGGGSSTSGSVPSKNIVYLQSGTSLFQSQDGGKASFFVNKRQRLNNCGDNNNEDNNVDFGKIKTECFGMKFTPCIT